MENLLRSILDSLTEGVIYQEASGEIKLWNKSAERMLGIAAAQAEGQTSFSRDWGMIFEDGSPCPSPEHPSMITLATGRPMEGQVRGMLRPDGSVTWVSINTRPLFQPGTDRPAAVVISLSDVTHARREERALRLSQEKFAKVFQHGPMLMTLSDLAGGALLDVNDAWCRTSGHTRDEALGRTSVELGWVTAAERAERIAELLARGRLQDREFTARAKGGRPVHVLMSAEVISLNGRKLVATSAVDITQRREAERELRRQRDRAQEYLEIVEAVIVALDVRGRVTLINRKGCELLGLAEPEIIGRDWFSDFLPQPEGIDQTYPVFHNLMAGGGGGVGHFENDIITAAGDRRTVAWHNTVIRDEDGRITGTLSAGEDVTERKKTEEELAKIFEMSLDLICLADINTYTFLKVNPAFSAKLGWSEGELLSRPFLEFIHPDDLEPTQKVVEEQLRRGRKVLEFTNRYRCKDGSYIWLDWLSHPVPERGITYAVAHDVTGRIKSETALRESEGRVRAKLDAILTPEGDLDFLELGDIIDLPAIQEMMESFSRLTNMSVAIMGTDGSVLVAAGWHDICTKFHRVNPASAVNCRESDTMLTRDLVPGKFKLYKCKNNLWDIVTPITIAGRHLGNLFLAQFLVAEEEPDREVFRAQAKKFGFDEEAYLAALDQVPRWGRDTTEALMRFHARLADLISNLSYSNLRLARTLAERTRESRERARLEEQLRQAQKMDALGTLASGIAHDFNNLLAAIMGYSELAVFELPPDSPVHGDISQITRAAGKARHLVRQILTFSRQAKAERRPVDLGRVIRETTGILERTLPKMVDLRLELGRDLPPVNADPHQMEQVVINLASNAADAMPEGGSLTIALRPITAQNQACDFCGERFSGPHLLLSVTDTGQGMDDETRAKMFDPFFTTKGVGKGTGLGLSTVYGIVTGHQGHLNCRSQKGRGTEFFIYLPVAQAQPTAENGGAPAPPEILTGQGTIQVVDDEPTVRDVAGRILAVAGYQVVSAASGEEALQVYQERGAEIDAVVMDLGMPGMGGKACLARLRDLDPTVRVLIASGYIQYELNDELEQLGARGLVSKPYGVTDLLVRIREMLQR